MMKEAGGARPDVLVIEDEQAAREALEAVLRLAGYHVRTACDGDEALRQVSWRRPDLVLTDISMPLVNGIELARWLRGMDRLNGMPIFAVTSLDRASIERSGATELFDMVFEKPVGLSRLLARVEEALS